MAQHRHEPAGEASFVLSQNPEDQPADREPNIRENHMNIAPSGNSRTQFSPSRPSASLAGSRPALMVTWAVGENFGGMTSMCLKRASLFHERGVPSAVVSFNPSPRFQAIQLDLITNKQLHPDVPVLNLHEYYATIGELPVGPQTNLLDHREVQWSHKSTTLRESDGTVFYVDSVSPGSEVFLHREYLRSDGSIYLTDSKLPDPRNPERVRRQLCLFDTNRQLRGSFPSASQLYRHWLSELVGNTPTDIIVDSKYSAGFLSSFDHPLATKAFVFHSTHVTAGANPLSGALTPSHESIIATRENWDGFIFLTDSQRRAYRARFDAPDNTHVISNPVDGTAELPDFRLRDSSKVSHVGRFTQGKNIPEVIEIVSEVRSSGVDITLDLIGDGDQKAVLETAVSELGLREIVKFRGHIHTVSDELAHARVLMLCSRYEGQSLAILEAQAAGCVPVAYDVDFGPRDVIDQELTGFLIPFQDKEAAAIAVARLLTDDALCESMSRLAFDSAKNYTSDAIFAQWIQALDAGRKLQPNRRAMASLTARLSSLSFRSDGTLEVEISTELHGVELTGLQLLISEGGAAVANAVTCEPYMADNERFSFVVPAKLRKLIPGEKPLDLHVRFESEDFQSTVRLGTQKRSSVLPFLTSDGNLSIK